MIPLVHSPLDGEFYQSTRTLAAPDGNSMIVRAIYAEGKVRIPQWRLQPYLTTV